MKYNLVETKQFKKDLNKVISQGKDPSKLRDVLVMLLDSQMLPEKYRDHKLTGNFKGCRECHIEPNWLLIYEIDDNNLILKSIRTGSHNQLRLTSSEYLVATTKLHRYF